MLRSDDGTHPGADLLLSYGGLTAAGSRATAGAASATAADRRGVPGRACQRGDRPRVQGLSCMLQGHRVEEGRVPSAVGGTGSGVNESRRARSSKSIQLRTASVKPATGIWQAAGIYRQARPTSHASGNPSPLPTYRRVDPFVICSAPSAAVRSLSPRATCSGRTGGSEPG
jgi:hypothetical protein